MALAASTIAIMHRIAGEEKHPQSRLWMAALQIQSAIDWSLWVRRVDIALIGGDPIVISRRICSILRDADIRTAPRIAVLHPGVFSGAPIAALEDPEFRAGLDLPGNWAIADRDMPQAIMKREIDRASALLASHGRGGVMAFEMVQGLPDPVRSETVLRLTRDKGVSRRNGLSPSSMKIPQVVSAGDDARATGLYSRSEQLFHQGLATMREGFGDFFCRSRHVAAGLRIW